MGLQILLKAGWRVLSWGEVQSNLWFQEGPLAAVLVMD